MHLSAREVLRQSTHFPERTWEETKSPILCSTFRKLGGNGCCAAATAPNRRLAPYWRRAQYGREVRQDC